MTSPSVSPNTRAINRLNAVPMIAAPKAAKTFIQKGCASIPNESLLNRFVGNRKVIDWPLVAKSEK